MLTEGEVENPDKVIKLAKANAERVIIHSFGVSSGCSEYLVENIAKAGKGTASFLVEQSNDLKGKVINALKKAYEPSYYGCKFDITSQAKPMLQSPSNGEIGEAFRNYPVN